MPTATLTDYLPLISEVPEARALAVRARHAALLASGWPDLDTRPNSPFGDLHLTPLAYATAAVEIAGERMFSDLVLENVANGTIFNCDFTREYVKNFAPVPREATKATGIVRLSFSTDDSRTIDRRALFAFGTGNIFGMRLAGPGHLSVLPVGSARSDTNQFVLTQTGRSVYVIDVPVAGLMASQVAEGASGTTDVVLARLVGITAMNSFIDGAYEDTVSGLAQKTRETFYSASLTSRGGAVAFLSREFPEIAAASAVLSGDLEMLRDSSNALGLVNGSLDILTRSKQAFQTGTQLIKLEFDAVLDKFIGKLSLAELPVKIDGIVCDTSPTVGLTYRILSKSLAPARAPLATCAYSELEQLYIEIEMPRADGARLITAEGDYAFFSVNYRFDPCSKHISTTLSSSDVRPVGVDVLAKTFTPVVISDFTINFVKRPGKQVNIEQARAEILAYVAKAGYPDVFLDSSINDSMLYAGASGIKSINVAARVQWSVASAFIPDSISDPLTDWAATIAAVKTPPVLSITSTGDLTPVFRDPRLGAPDATMVVAGKRNLTYILDSSNLHFSEYSL